jgi:predicted SAM-dependent methyltransferase
MRLHLGCAHFRLPSPWVNADALEGSDRVLDMAELWPLDAESCSWVYSSHTLEHIEFDRLPKVLAGLHRVIRPGGKLTLATISIEAIYNNRYKAGARAASWISALYGDSWGLSRPFVSHKCAFDAPLLTGLLEDAGFRDIRRWEPKDYPEILALHDCATTDRDVSLLLEATA